MGPEEPCVGLEDDVKIRGVYKTKRLCSIRALEDGAEIRGVYKNESLCGG